MRRVLNHGSSMNAYRGRLWGGAEREVLRKRSRELKTVEDLGSPS